MDTGLWVVQGILAVMFLMVGMAMLTKPKEELADRMDWVEDFSEGAIKFIGGIEILAAIGLILPGYQMAREPKSGRFQRPRR